MLFRMVPPTPAASKADFLAMRSSTTAAVLVLSPMTLWAMVPASVSVSGVPPLMVVVPAVMVFRSLSLAAVRESMGPPV